nr:hypothetical protein [Tanacetum cinerariifolium]
MPLPNPNNTYTKPPLEIQILNFIKTLGYDEDPKTNLIAISKMVATRLHQPWRAILSVLNRSLTGKDSRWDTVRLPILHIKVESGNAKIVDEPKKQHASLVKRGRGKGFMCYGDQVANVSNKLKKDEVPRKTRALTIAEEAVVGLKASRLKSLKQKKQAVAEEGSSAAHKKYYDSSDTDSDAILYSSSSDKTEESANETDDADESDMNLSDNNLDGDDDDARYGVFIHNKYTATPNSNYLSLTVISSSLDCIQTLLDETPANELQAIDAQDVEPSFHKRSHDHLDPLNNREGKSKKKRRKD